MQWMFMLIGLVPGWMLDESFSDALLGALLGLGIGQAIRIGRLVSQVAEHRVCLSRHRLRCMGSSSVWCCWRSRASTAEGSEPAPSADIVVDEVLSNPPN